ncbi:hypothetical protein TKK_0017380 [Trichogramma kaykai]|uniref:Uncharacterized protein n=1 Tax=Trichogramma kaykai TaxID=54128 RepID=A0ABD2W3W3_9HYME
MTYGTNFYHHNDNVSSDKCRFENENGDRPCNASPEETILNNINSRHSIGNGSSGTGLGSKLKCPASISRLKVEKIEGGLMVAGVVVAANCQIALPAFGFLFVLAGAVLTAASYRGPGEDEDKNSYAARIAFTGNSRVLGPICIAVGLLMLLCGSLLCMLTRRARRRERRVGFHCPLHGDFYPLNSSQGVKLLGKSSWMKIPCFRSNGKKLDSQVGPPQCPHSVLSSTRSSVSSSPLSPCPTPMPFLVTSGSISGMHISAAANMSPDQTFGSIRSLSVTREVASFPLSRTPTPPPQHRTMGANSEDPENPIISEPSPRPVLHNDNASSNADKNHHCTIDVQPLQQQQQPQQPQQHQQQQRKSVVIVLPNEQPINA